MSDRRRLFGGGGPGRTIAAVSVMQILLVSVVMVLIGRFGRGLRDSAR